MIKPTIFETLALADMERIHTQMLSWIFNQDNSIISSNNKSDILRKLFSIEECFDDFKAFTEHKNLDLLIETTSQSKASIFVIEVKLKSSESPGQTDKYKKAIEKNHKHIDNKYYCFLTLVSDKAKSKGWKNATFEDLLEALVSIELDKEITEKRVFFKEYIQTLKNLTTTYKMFSEDHQKFENVFTDGSKTKYDKRKEKQPNVYRQYISDNQLETIFQKCFFRTLFSHSNVFSNQFLVKHYTYYREIKIEETRGSALIELLSNECEIENKIFYFGWQLQGSTLKIIFHINDKDYPKSDKKLIEGTVETEFKGTFHEWNGYDRLNRAKSRAYISVSKQLPKGMWEHSIKELSTMLAKELDMLHEKSKHLELLK